jgi:hypothetical protein
MRCWDSDFGDNKIIRASGLLNYHIWFCVCGGTLNVTEYSNNPSTGDHFTSKTSMDSGTLHFLVWRVFASRRKTLPYLNIMNKNILNGKLTRCSSYAVRHHAKQSTCDVGCVITKVQKLCLRHSDVTFHNLPPPYAEQWKSGYRRIGMQHCISAADVCRTLMAATLSQCTKHSNKNLKTKLNWRFNAPKITLSMGKNAFITCLSWISL